MRGNFRAARMPTTPTFELARLREVVGRFAGRRIGVLGDVMVDRYLWGRVERISPEAPVPVVEIDRESFSLGGAGNVAANLASLGAKPVLFSVCGTDPEGRTLREALATRGVDATAMVEDPARPTTIKTRIIAHSQQVVRADRESRADLNNGGLDRLVAAITSELPKCEALIVSDYGKGVIHPATLAPAIATAKKAKIPICVDPKESHIDHYRGVSILTPNQHEAGYVQGKRIVDEASLAEDRCFHSLS